MQPKTEQDQVAITCHLTLNRNKSQCNDRVNGKYANERQDIEYNIKETSNWPFIILGIIIIILIGFIFLMIKKIKSYSSDSEESNQNTELPKFQKRMKGK